jgi:hypothetical protein
VGRVWGENHLVRKKGYRTESATLLFSLYFLEPMSRIELLTC